jgi:hypothetical protein
MAPKDSAEREGASDSRGFRDAQELDRYRGRQWQKQQNSRNPPVRRAQFTGSTQISASCVSTGQFVYRSPEVGIISRKWGPSALIQISTEFFQASFASFVHVFFEDVESCFRLSKKQAEF